MYAGTGDMYNYQPGGGIWKTTNGGTTWNQLSSTIPGGNSPAISRAFDCVQRIVVNNSGQVFVATQYGVVRSMDGGTTWSYALAPNQAIGVGGAPTNNYYNDKVTDLELGSDGILYAGFNPGRVFRSNDATGTAWTEITPPGAGGERTELALAPSTSGAGQVIYGVSRANNNVNYGQDIKWFKKSVNGGASWADVVIPAFSYGDHFTTGNGAYALNLSVHPTDPNTVYAGGFDWFRSTNSGVSWSSRLLDTYTYQQTLLFHPGSPQSAALGGEQGVFWSINWNDASVSQPTILNKNNGYRAGVFYSVAMKAIPGSNYLIGGTQGSGAIKITSPNLSAGFLVNSIASDMGLTFIDEDNPSIQILSSYYGRYQIYNGYSNLNYPLTINGTALNPTDYDSQSNTLYGYEYKNGGHTIRKMTDLVGTMSITDLSISGVVSTPSFFRLSSNKESMFVGTSGSQIYKITNLSQPTPTVTAIDNGAFPQYTTVSCIDVGADDNELLVTLSNYGVQSVWYTTTGGSTWIGKDQSNYGLPDVPVRSALFNPQNRTQVLLGTDLGIWSTTDITAASPGWGFTSNGVGTFRVNQLRYRASDGRMAAATAGRGVFTSDAFAIPFTPSTITLTSVSNTSLCAGSAVSVAFSTSGPAFATSTPIDVWVSDATGSFANQRKLGTGTSSPISVTLISGYNALPFSINYRLKLMAPAPDVESGTSDALAIGDLTSANLTDRRSTASSSYSDATICPNSRVTVTANSRNGVGNPTMAEGYQWTLNGTAITGATSQTVSAQQAGTYRVTVRQAGCTVLSSTYQLTVSNTPYASVQSTVYDAPQCSDRPAIIGSSYAGETATYQWTRDGTDIAGANSTTLSANQTGPYSFRLTDGACTATAYPQQLTFGQSLFARAIRYPGVDSVLCAGSSSPIYMSADQISSEQISTGIYAVQWFRDNVALTGANATSNYYAYQPGSYSFELRQGSCSTRSNALVVGQGVSITPVITYSFRSKIACPGETRFLLVEAIFGNYTYQWQKDGVDIPGATSNGYSAQVSGAYAVRLIRGSCSATSLPLSLTFSNAILPTIYFSEYCANTYLGFNDPHQLPGYQYTWYQNGAPVSGETNSYIFAGQAGVYSVRVTNGSCTGLSKGVYVGTGRVAKPVIALNQPGNQLCENNSFRLTAAYNSGNLQWKRNGIALTKATSNIYYATQSGVYSAVVQDGSCTAESDPVEVKIGEPTSATLLGNALITSGTLAQLPVSFSGPAPWSFTLTNGQSVQNTYQNPYRLPVSPTTNTTYQLATVQNACGSGTTAGSATVRVGSGSADVSLNMVVSNRSPKVNDIIDYTFVLTNAGPQEAAGVQVRSRLPAGMSFVEAISPGVSVADGVVIADAGMLFVNGTSRLSFRAKATQPGVFAASAQVVSSQTPDPDSQPGSGTGDGQDDAATADLRTVDASGQFVVSANPDQVPLPRVTGNQPVADPATADLSLSIGTLTLIPVPSDVLTVTVRISNRGGSAASAVVVQTLLPTGWALANTAGFTVSGQTVSGYLNQLPAGQWVTLTLPVRVGSTAGRISAQISDMAETDSDSTPGNGYENGEDDEAMVSVRVR